MSDTEVGVSFAEAVQGRTKSYEERITEAGTDFKESHSLFVKSIDKAKRQITALASTADLDRHNEVILPEAFRELLPIYMKSGGPVITSHQHRLETGHSSLIGNTIKAWIDQQGLWVTIEFIEGTALGEEYGMLYLEKKQRALSVGFIDLEHRYEERDGKSVYVLTKVELLEISCVVVGANREALSKRLSKSKQKKHDFVTGKKEEREEEKILAELRQKNPQFDEDAGEFAEALLVGFDNITTCDFAKLISGKPSGEYTALVSK